MSERLGRNHEKEPASLYKFAERLIENARQKASALHGRQSIRHDYFKSYENMGGVVWSMEQLNIKATKNKFYEMVVSREDGNAFDPSEFIDMDEDKQVQFVAIKFTIKESIIYAEGSHDLESEPVPLRVNENTIGYILEHNWLKYAIYGRYVPPGEKIPAALDRWDRRI